MWRLREHAWAIAITTAAVSAYWFWRDNPHTLWADLLTDRNILALGLIPLVYTIFCALHHYWIGPRLLLRRHSWIEQLARDNHVRAAALEELERTRGARERRLEEHPQSDAVTEPENHPLEPSVVDAASPQPAEVDKAACQSSVFRTTKLLGAGFAGGILGTLGYIFYLGKELFPNVSFKNYFWFTIDYLSGSTSVCLAAWGSIQALIFLALWPWIGSAREKAEKIIAQAEQDGKEIKDQAEQEVKEFLGGANQEAGKIINGGREEAERSMLQAEAEAAEILDRAQQDAAVLVKEARDKAHDLWSWADVKGRGLEAREKALVQREQVITEIAARSQAQAGAIMESARREAQALIADALSKAPAMTEAEVAEILDRARHEARMMIAEAKKKTKDLWSWVEAKAKEGTVTPEEWKEVKEARKRILDTAREEAAVIVARARAKLEQYPRHQINEDLNRAGQEDVAIVGQAQTLQADRQGELPAGDTNHYYEDIDSLTCAFISDRCLVKSENSANASDLYRAYGDWAQLNGVENPLPQNLFGASLRRLRYEPLKTKKCNLWRGISLA